jgi:hypothetical protein
MQCAALYKLFIKLNPLPDIIRWQVAEIWIISLQLLKRGVGHIDNGDICFEVCDQLRGSRAKQQINRLFFSSFCSWRLKYFA